MIRYVLGFAFSRLAVNVVLIQKNKPEWQRDRLNGIGGKIENGEQAIDAMRREFFEETGLRVDKWQQYCILRREDEFQCTCFWTMDADIYKARKTTDEEIFIKPVNGIANNPQVVPNVPWLVEMAKNQMQEQFQAVVSYSQR